MQQLLDEGQKMTALKMGEHKVAFILCNKKMAPRGKACTWHFKKGSFPELLALTSMTGGTTYPVGNVDERV